MQDPAFVPTQPEPYSTAHVVHALVQFGVAVRHRMSVVILSLLVCALLGGLYFATATRYYGAKAQLLVLQSGDDVSTSMTAQGNRQQSLMPTYEPLFTSAKVLDVAIASLLPEDRIDLVNAPRERWVEMLQKEVTAKSIYNSNIIEISYSSKDPGAAVAVVNAVVKSYLAFMDETHKGTAGEIIKLLTKEKDDLTERLGRKEEERQEIRTQLGMVGTLGTNREVLHPLVQRAVSFNEALIETQKQRVSMEASLVSIRGAVRNGEDLRQHLLDISEVVGREVMLSALGENPRDAATQAALDQRIITDQANLASLEEHCGPNHHKVAALREEIRLAEQSRGNYQERTYQRLTQLQGGQLASMLVSMVEQKLKELCQKEASLQEQYERAYAQANQLNSQLARLEMVEFDVKGLRDLHETLLKNLADVTLRQEGTEIRPSVVSEPVKNEKPISPSLRTVVLMVLLGGLGLGLLLVYVLDTLDDRFRSVEELQRQLGTAVLSVVRRCPSGTSSVRRPCNSTWSPTPPRARPSVRYAPRFRWPTASRGRSWSPARSRATGKRPSWPTWPSATPSRPRRPCSSTPTCVGPADQLAGNARRGRTFERDPRPRGRGGDGGHAHPSLGDRRARRVARRPPAHQSGRTLGQRPLLRTAGLGRNGLRSDPHRQPARPGRQRRGPHRPDGRTAWCSWCNRPRIAAAW